MGHQKKIRILHIGDFRFDFYDMSFFDALSSDKNIDAEKFEIAQYFISYKYKNIFEKFYYGIQNRYKFGPVIDQINQDIIKKVSERKYNFVFIWRGVHIKPETLQYIKSFGVKILGYNNDSTYSLHHPAWLFRLLKKQIKLYDHFYAYRESDIPCYERNGCKSSLFLPTFDPTRTYPINNIHKTMDMVFIGHYEDDGRDQLFLELAKTGFRIGLHGQGWHASPHYKALKSTYGDIKPVYSDYNKILNSSKIALNLLSGNNGDSYTRRSLEIPATRTAMLAPLTPKHIEWFKPDIEAFYFKKYSELPDILRRLLLSPVNVQDVANAGYLRVINGDFQLKHRVDMILQDYHKLHYV